MCAETFVCSAYDYKFSRARACGLCIIVTLNFKIVTLRLYDSKKHHFFLHADGVMPVFLRNNVLK